MLTTIDISGIILAILRPWALTGTDAALIGLSLACLAGGLAAWARAGTGLRRVPVPGFDLPIPPLP